MARIQQNILAVPERRVLDWLCVRLAGYVSPDQLTALTVVGGAVVLLGYGLGRWVAPDFLWLAVLGYLLHWFGDSMDGSMARYLKQERPRYGYFVDHSTDALGNSLIMVGLGLSGFVRMDVALSTLVGYLLMSIHVFLRNTATGDFQLSFLVMGPTELRVCLVVITLMMRYVGGGPLWHGLTAYDFVISGTSVILTALFIQNTLSVARMLRARGEGPRAS